MAKPSLNFGFYIGLVVAGAVAVSSVTLGKAASVSNPVWAWTAALALATYLGALFMLPLARNLKLEVSTVTLFAAVLLLPTPLAMLAGAAGHLAAAFHLRRRPYNILFNAGEVALRVGVASLVFNLFHPEPFLAVTVHPLLWLALGSVTTALVMFGMNTMVVSGLVAVRQGKPLQQVWLMGRKMDTVPELALYALGFVAVLLGQDHPWALPLLAVPVVAVYFALKDRVAKMELAEKLRQQMEELKQTQAQLIQSGRLASVGTLAAGVAHEINNPIFVIGGNAELLLASPDKYFRTETAQHRVEVIYQMSQRIAQIVSSLLSFSRSKDQMEPVSLNQAADEVVNLVGHSLASQGVTLERQYQPDLPPIMGRKSQVEQVMMNLVLNARDAMPQGGTLTITTWAEGTLAAASFADTGLGLSPQVQERLYQPFFTTKEPSKGTGLGLYISRRIIEEHGGEIRLESQEGKGATFTLLFPALEREVVGAGASRSGSRLPVPSR